MRLEQLHFFVTVANCRSINKASEYLHISQQSLHFSMKKMEQELGYTLFLRDNQGVSLTPSGQLVYAVAQEILNRNDYMLKALKEINSVLPNEVLFGHLNIVTNNSTILLGKVIRDMMNKYPACTFNVKEKNTPYISSALAANEDVICFLATLKDTFNLDKDLLEKCYIEPLFDSKSYVLLTHSHPLSKYKSVSIKSLLKYPLVSYEVGEDDYNLIFDVIAQFGVPNFKLITNSIEIFLEAIFSGQTIGVLNKVMLDNSTAIQENNNVTYIPIREALTTSVYAVSTYTYYHRNQQLIDVFLNMLKEYI